MYYSLSPVRGIEYIGSAVSQHYKNVDIYRIKHSGEYCFVEDERWITTPLREGDLRSKADSQWLRDLGEKLRIPNEMRI